MLYGLIAPSRPSQLTSVRKRFIQIRLRPAHDLRPEVETLNLGMIMVCTGLKEEAAAPFAARRVKLAD
ncbi:MAG: hypothetical protein RIA71_03670 [Oceanicaulis sp.]